MIQDWQGKIDMVSNIGKARFARLKGKMGKVEFKVCRIETAKLAPREKRHVITVQRKRSSFQFGWQRKIGHRAL